MRPDINELKRTLKREKGRFVPNMELGIHPVIKQQLLGRPVISLEDDIAFWHTAGYDYVKLQPGVDFNPAKIGPMKNLTFSQDGTTDRTWASEGTGIITCEKDLAEYRFPSSTDFDYSRFEKVRSLLPEGMGVIGQYGDIFTMT
jgi:uroporphyrinogen decarboxylase